jgi:hypothetical protein
MQRQIASLATTRPGRGLSVALALTLAVIALGGCGSGGHPTVSHPSTPPKSTTTTYPPTAVPLTTTTTSPVPHPVPTTTREGKPVPSG